jgi:hypothetical protein
MTDCDQAQISALETVYPQTWVILCRWHVLHAIQSHFQTDHFLGAMGSIEDISLDF